jgi:aminotransferase
MAGNSSQIGRSASLNPAEPTPANVEGSDIRRMTTECARLGGLNLAQGACALPVSFAVQQAAIHAIERNENAYTPTNGIMPLREAIAEKLLRDNALPADPDTEIVVTSGATGAYVSALHALLKPGDGVIFLEPFYGYHVQAAKLASLAPQFVALPIPDFVVSEDVLEPAITPATRAIVLSTPCNPSGRMLRPSELEAIGLVAERHDLLLISDEIYEYIRFDGYRHISPASISGLAGRTVTIMGMAKTYNVTGWRMGYVFAPSALAAPIRDVSEAYYVCAPAPFQHAMVEALKLPISFYRDLRSRYQAKRTRLCAALTRAGLRPYLPEGAIYVLADIAHMGLGGSQQVAMTLLESTGIASVPGTAFFRSDLGHRFIRFCFAVTDDILEAACEHLSGFAGRFHSTNS